MLPNANKNGLNFFLMSDKNCFTGRQKFLRATKVFPAGLFDKVTTAFIK